MTDSKTLQDSNWQQYHDAWRDKIQATDSRREFSALIDAFRLVRMDHHSAEAIWAIHIDNSNRQGYPKQQ